MCCLPFQVKYKQKAEIIVKMRKAEAGRWVDRWSPRREQASDDADAVTAEPIITLPSDDDDDDE